MQQYSYKESGIEWLGNIPEHWSVDRLRDLCIINDQTLSKSTRSDFIINYIDIGNVNSLGIIDFNEIEELSYEEAPSRARRIIHVGDTIISSVRTNLQAVAHIDFKKENLIGSTGFFVCRPKFIEILSTRFLYYFLLTDYSKDFFVSRSVGVSYPAIDDYKFSSINIPLPPLLEQKAIAEYLDKACARIDRIIAIKEEQLRKIEAYFRERITECTTQGLNQSVEFKSLDSKWLKKTPSHWEVKKVKRICKIFRGKFTHRPRNDPRFYDGEYPFIQTGSVTNADKYITTYSQTLNELGLGVSELFPSGTLTMTIAANIGDVAILTFDACFPDSIVGFKPGFKMDVEFLYYQFLGIRQDFLSTAIVTTQMNLNITRIGDVNCYVPPFDEQKEIVLYLENLSSMTRKLQEKVKNQITTLQTYRKSLIHECVTGKKQVYTGKLRTKKEVHA